VRRDIGHFLRPDREEERMFLKSFADIAAAQSGGAKARHTAPSLIVIRPAQ